MSRRVPKTAMDQRPEGNPPEPAPEQHQPRLSTTQLPGSIFTDANGVLPVWRFLIYVGLYYVLRLLLLSLAGAAVSRQSDDVNPLWLEFLEECLLLVAAAASGIISFGETRGTALRIIWDCLLMAHLANSFGWE